MTNFDTARDALETSLNSAGSAMAEHEKWQKSLEAQILKLKASWQGLSQAFLSSDFLHTALDWIIKLVDGLTLLIDKVGTLPTLLGVFAGFKTIKSLPTLIRMFQLFGRLDAKGLLNVANVTRVLSVVFPKATKGAKTFGGAIKSMFTAMTAHPIIAVITAALAALIGVFTYQSKKAEELAEKVGELTDSYKQNHDELKKLKNDYDTSNESSMVSKYAKLSKGVDGLGRNVSLTADEYSEYQSIVNQIAEQIPSLVSGYDEQGNALLSCKGNVEELTAAYEKLIHAQNNEILSNAGDIEKDFENELKKKDSTGFWGNKLSIDGVELLKKVQNGNLSKKEIQNLLDQGLLDDSIGVALKQAGVDGVSQWSTSAKVAKVLAEVAKSDPQKLQSIIENFDSELDSITDGMKTIAQAKLSEAFDVGSVISGIDYGNIGEELQTIAYQTVNSLDFDFFEGLKEQGKTVEQWTKEFLNQLNTIGKVNGDTIKDAFELQTQFNGGDINYGDYIKKLRTVEDTINKLDLKDEAKNQLKISLGLDENGVVDQYDALIRRLTSKEIGLSDSVARNFLNSLSAEELSVAMDIIPKLDAGTTVDEIESLINDKLAEEFKFDIEVQTAGIEALNTALAESRSAAGLTSESIAALEARYEDLDGFNAAALFEKTANGIRLNSDELSRLEEQYVNTNKLEIDKNLNALIEKYQDVTEEIKTCTDAQKKEELQASADYYKDKIDELSTLASQYDGLTSAFTKWQNALNGAEEGDNYDSVFENLEAMNELDDKGLVGTDKYKAFAQLFSYEDLSSAGIDKIGKAFDKGYKKAERYFTEGQKGSKNFLNDLHAINSEWAHINKDGVWEVDINAEEAAKKLGISVEAVLLILDKLKDYGIKVEVEDTSVDNLQTKIQETEAKLKELGQSPVDINVDIEASSSNLGKIESEIEKAKSKIAEINNSSVDPKVKTAQLEDARAKLEALIQKKQEVSQPAFMNLNTSQVNASLVDALEKIQSYQTALNELNELKELKSAGIAIDDSEISAAEEKLDGFAKAIQGLDGDVKVAIGLEEDGSIDSIHKAFADGKVKIDADTDPAVSKIGELAKTVEKISDKDITINVTVNGLDQVKELNKQINLATDIQGDIDKLSEYVENAKALKDLGENITSYVTAEVKGNVINTFEYKLDNLKVFTDSAKDIEEIGYVQSEVSANIKGNVIDEFEYKIDNLKVYSDSAKNVSDIGDVESTVKANIEGNVTDEFEYKINNLKVFSDSAKDIYKIGNVESNVKATINSGEDGDVIDEFEYKLDNLKKFAEYAKELQGLSDVKISVEATVNTGGSDDVVEEFEYKLDNLSEFANHVKELQGLESVNVSVNATVNTGDGSAIDEFEYKLNNLEEFAEGAKALQGIGNVSSEITAKVNTGESGDVVDTFEYKLDNLKTFAEGAKALQGVGNVSSTVTAEINSGSDGDVIDEFEYKLNNLEKFAQYAKDLQGVGSVNVSVSAKVNTGEDGDVTDTFEYKLNNLDEFASYAKELQGLEDVNITIKANVDTGDESVTNEWEYRLNNLNDFATYAKDLQGLESVDITITANTKGNVVGEKTEGKINNLEVFAKGAKGLQELEDVDLTVKATVSGDVTETAEYKLDNLGVFKKHAKELQGIKDVDISVNAEISGNVPEKTEGYLDDLQVFAKGAKALQGLNDVDLSVNADIGGNVPEKTEGYLDDLQVFAKGAKALQGLSNVDISVNADVSGNAVTGDGVTGRLDRLTEFKSLVSGMSDKTVTVKVTANVDSEKVNDAITLLQDVADSGVFKNYTSTVQVGAKVSSIDDTVVKNYIATEKTAKGKVVWSNNDTAVNEFKNKIHEATGKVNWGNNTENVKKSFTATGTVNWSSSGSPKLPDFNGDGDPGWVNGTAHANGTAFKQGDWRTKKTETALVGEVGREIIVTPENKWYTVGDAGAEFARIPRGSIVFNNKQTEQLFKYGKVTVDGGRAKALVNGAAFASGTAFEGGSGMPKDETPKKADPYDWIEILLTRLERAINNFTDTVDDEYSSWTERKNALYSIDDDGNPTGALVKNKELITKLDSAMTAYENAANKVELSESIKEKVRNGTLDPNDSSITEEQSEKIQEYRTLWENYLDTCDKYTEAQRTQLELQSKYFDMAISKYDGLVEGYEHKENMIDEYIAQAEAKGHLISGEYYKELIKNNDEQIIPALIQQREEMIAARDSLNLDTDSEKYIEMSNEINKVTQEIEQAKTQTLEWQNEIRQLNWDNLDLAREKISRLNDEADFFVELMSNKKLFNDDGSMTNEGLSTMGMYAQKHNTHMYLANDYASEIEEIDKQIAALDEKGDYDENLNKRRQELVELQRESILAAEDEKQAIKDLISEGYDKELDALQEKIDLYNESIESAKDLYDYQKNVQEQTENISSLQKQLRAYEGFDDEETRATVQQLKVELESAQQDLQETEYDKFISDQSALLDELYLEYETVLNERLDNLDGLIEESFATVNEKADTINTTIENVAGEVGIEMSEELGNIWSGEGGIEGVVTGYYEGFKTDNASVIKTLGEIKGYISTLAGKSDEEAKENIKQPTTTTSATSNHSSGSGGSKPSSSSGGNKSTNGDGKVKIGDKVKFLSGKYYYDSQGVNPAGSKNHGKQVYITNINKKSWATHPYHISTGKKLGSGDLGWLKLNQISGYATGKKNFLNNEIAWTQENGKEFIVRPSDGAILTPIAKGDSVLNAQASGNIWNMANSPAEFIKDNLNLGVANVPNGSSVNNSCVQNFENIIFSMPNVRNYEQLLSEMQKDPKFDKLIKAMTIDQIAGKSSLAKNKSIR